VEEIIQNLEAEIAKARNTQPIDSELLKLLFAPTGAIQETAKDHGWAENYLKISEIVDEFTNDK